MDVGDRTSRGLGRPMQMLARGNIVITCYFRARKDEFFAFLRSIPRCYKNVSSLPNLWLSNHPRPYPSTGHAGGRRGAVENGGNDRT